MSEFQSQVSLEHLLLLQLMDIVEHKGSYMTLAHEQAEKPEQPRFYEG